MRYVLFGFLLLFLSVLLGLEISRHAGYVLILYHNLSIETSLWVALIILLCTFVALYLLVRFLVQLFSLSRRIRRWRQMRRQKKVRYLSQHGLCQLAEGYWHKAERSLVKAAKISKSSLVHYLGAAYAAQAQQEYQRRDEYLRRAQLAAPSARLAVGLTQAQLQVNSEQWEQALAILTHLHTEYPDHPVILRLLQKVYLHLNDWTDLENLLPALRQNDALDDKDWDALAKKIYIEKIINSTNVTSASVLWEDAPRHLQHQLDMQTAYAKTLVKLHDDTQAAEFIEHTLKKYWQPELAIYYSQLKIDTPNRQLKHIENWLDKHPGDAQLLLAAGLINIRQKFWGRGIEFLKSSLAIAPSVAAWTALAKAYLGMGDTNEALNCYQAATQLALHNS